MLFITSKSAKYKRVGQAPLQMGNILSVLPSRRVQERTNSPGPSDDMIQEADPGAFINSSCRCRLHVSPPWDTAEKALIHRAPCTGHLDSAVYKEEF